MISTAHFHFLPSLPTTILPLWSHLCFFSSPSFALRLPVSSTRNYSLCLLLPAGYSLCRPCVWFCVPREQFLKSNAQLTFRCRQLLSELSYIYPIDVVRSTWWCSTLLRNTLLTRQLHRILWLQNQGFDQAEMVQIVLRALVQKGMLRSSRVITYLFNVPHW